MKAWFVVLCNYLFGGACKLGTMDIQGELQLRQAIFYNIMPLPPEDDLSDGMLKALVLFGSTYSCREQATRILGHGQHSSRVECYS